jgi:hypothetical protein
VAPDASIECADVANTCQMGKPQCFPGPTGYCSIRCGSAASSCGAGYCCDAGGTGTCDYSSAVLRNNTCP